MCSAYLQQQAHHVSPHVSLDAEVSVLRADRKQQELLVTTLGVHFAAGQVAHSVVPKLVWRPMVCRRTLRPPPMSLLVVRRCCRSSCSALSPGSSLRTYDDCQVDAKGQLCLRFRTCGVCTAALT